MTNIVNQAASFAKAIAIQVAAGCPTADKDEQKKRHDICGTCPLLDIENYKCKKCGCKLHLKIPLGTSKCPLGKW